MRDLSAIAVLLFCSLPPAFAQATPADPFHNEPMVWEHYDTTYHMHADGTGDYTVHVVARLQSDGAVRQFSVIQVGFASAYETGSIDYIRVHKPDGSVVETPVSDAIEMPAPVTTMAPLYSDLKTKQVPVRSLAAGDVIDYQLRTVKNKAEVPGHFWGAHHFLTEGGVVLAETITLDVPADTYVQVWDPNHPTTPKQHDGLRTYTWTSSQLKLTGKDSAGRSNPVDPDEDEDGRKKPSVAWTTFHSWPEVGNWYRDLSLSRSAPTPAIVSRANDLTKSAKTPDEQVRALYDFVAKQTRYVGIDFGVGHYQPHAAEEVMNYQYGDCKDKDTLFEALLRSKGFTTAPALIGVNITPVPDLPSPALFNHVITTVDLPSGRIWLDTTAEVAPYRMLISPIRDEQALVVPATGAARLERTPADPPYPFLERFEAVGSLDKDGLLNSHMDMTLRSDNELGFRILLQRVAPAQWDQAMQSVSSALGFAGTVSNPDFRQKDPAGPVHLGYDYKRPEYADWDHHRILPLFPVLEIASIDKDKAPEHNIDQGEPRTLEAVTRIRLPDGFKAELPADVHVKRPYATYDLTYHTEKDELVIERTTVILKRKVPKDDWKDYLAYIKATGVESGYDYITLIAPGAPPAFPEALQKASEAIKQDRWSDAEQILDEVKAKDPKTPYLMSMFAAVAVHQGKPKDALQDYLEEVANNPTLPTHYLYYIAGMYVAQKRYPEAEAFLQKYLDRNDVSLYRELAFAQTKAGQDDAAVSTLQTTTAKFPDDAEIQSMLVKALHHVHRDQDAADVAKKLLLATDKPFVLNNNAYELSTLKLELPLAETSSRRAIATLEKDLSAANLAQQGDEKFSETNLLVATWDTLGWILFQQGKPADAEPYVRAAWVNEPGLTVGNHLAQILEALGQPVQAITLDELALASVESATSHSPDIVEVKANVERLRHNGARSTVGDAKQTLQKMRTFHVEKPAATAGSATLQVAVASDHFDDVALVSGPAQVEALALKLKQTKMAAAIPDGSAARLFRDGILYCSAGSPTCEFLFIDHKFNANH